jgi:hypothetical protein
MEKELTIEEEKKWKKAKKWMDSLDKASKERLRIYLEKRLEEFKENEKK